MALATILLAFEWVARTQLGLQNPDARVVLGLGVVLLVYSFARRANPVDVWESNGHWLMLSIADGRYSTDFEEMNREIIAR